MTDPSPQPDHRSEPIEAEIVPDGPPPGSPAALPPAPVIPAPDYDERGVPSFDYVREKIEGRHATALGAAELLGEPAGPTAEEQEADRERAAAAKLEEIRRSLG